MPPGVSSGVPAGIHLAMVEVDDEGNAASWGDHVTDEEYSAAQ